MLQPHIQCEKVSKMVLLPGDPSRVDRVAKFLQNPKEIAYNREFKTVVGQYKDTEITVTSTGIGGSSAVIALEELVSCGGEYFIRIGSCGATQDYINIGDLILSMASVREDGASNMYINNSYPAVCDYQILSTLNKKAKELNLKHHIGITRSHDSFYIDDEMQRMRYWNSKNVLGSDMETSALFTVGKLRNVKVGSILNNVVLYDDDLKEGVNEYVNSEDLAAKGEENEIILALEALNEINIKLNEE